MVAAGVDAASCDARSGVSRGLQRLAHGSCVACSYCKAASDAWASYQFLCAAQGQRDCLRGPVLPHLLGRWAAAAVGMQHVHATDEDGCKRGACHHASCGRAPSVMRPGALATASPCCTSLPGPCLAGASPDPLLETANSTELYLAVGLDSGD